MSHILNHLRLWIAVGSVPIRQDCSTKSEGSTEDIFSDVAEHFATQTWAHATQ